MKNITLSVVALTLLLVSLSACFFNKSGKNSAVTPSAEGDSTALALLKNNCLSCHSTNAQSHDDLIAPPMIAVKRRYSTVYSEREDFIRHIVSWAKKPKAENAIMYGAVNRFKVMPYAPYKEKDLQRIAAYLYDNEIEKPEWFDAHFKEMHPDGRAVPNQEMNKKP